MPKKHKVTGNKGKFQEEWCHDPDYKDWVVKNKTSIRLFGCRWCKKYNLSISNMGVQALISHTAGAGHKRAKDLIKSNKSFFTPLSAKRSSKDDTTAEKTIPEVKTPKLDDKGKLKAEAEIVWAFNVVYTGQSLHSNDHTAAMFKRMFPDSAIAHSFRMMKDKLSYITNHGLAVYVKEELLKEVNESPCYSISYDESLNQELQKCQMDLIVRYWNVKQCKVSTRYLGSQYLGHAKALDIKENLYEGLKGIVDTNKMCQLAMDGPRVNLKLLEEVKKDRRKEEKDGLFDIGSCSLHIVHGAFKNGAEGTRWSLKNTMKGSWKLFDDSPARTADYMKITESDDFPFGWCGTRWTEDDVVAAQLVKVWPNMVKMIQHYEKDLPPSKRPQSKSYGYVVDAVQDLLTVPKLEYFYFIASKLRPFLTFFQSEDPLLPFLHGFLVDVIKSLLELFMKTSVVDSIAVLPDLEKFDLTKKTSLLKVTEVNIGFAARHSLAKLVHSDDISSADAFSFREDCVTFVTEVIKSIMQRVPLKSSVLKNSSCFAPELLLKYPEKCKRRLTKLIDHCIQLGKIDSSAADQILVEFKTSVVKNPKLKSFDIKKHRLDEFYFNEIHAEALCPTLAKLLKMIFVISHGQGSVERGFSHNKTVLQTNIGEISVISKRLVKDYLISKNVLPHQVEVTKEMRTCVSGARQRWQMYLEQNKKDKQTDEAVNAVTVIKADLKDMKEKLQHLKDEIMALRKEANSFFQKASQQRDLNLCNAGNALSDRASNKEKEADELTELISKAEERLVELSK